MEMPVSGIKGVILVDANGRVAFATGIGGDKRISALAQDSDWLEEARTRRLQPLILDRVSYALLVMRVQQGDLIIINEAPGQAVMDFLGSVDFAYDVLEHLLTNPFEAMTIVDSRKRIVYISPVHEGFFGLSRGEANGRPVKEIIENTRLDRVIDTGKPEVGEIQRMKGLERIVSRIPIKHNGKIAGAIGRIMFKGPEQLDQLMRRIHTLEGQVEFYRREASILRDRTYGLENLIGDSPAMRKLRSEITKVAPLEVPVLITGESGTGKELVAHSLHQLSPRRDAEMVMLNAAALPATLVESELFGYAPGAFTGADKKGRKGKFEQAANGTIFLDEIGDMPLDIQVKLLRVLQDRRVERIGGDHAQEIDFRLISATNCDLRQLIAESKFRLDLFYRISAVVIDVPPLRMRIADVPELANHFLRDMATRHGRPMPEFTPCAYSYLMDQRWPGNVRQLRHEVERAFIFAEDGRINADVLSQHADIWNGMPALGTQPLPPASNEPTTLKDAVSNLEGEVIRQAMIRYKGNKKRVASELQISRSYLYKVLELQGIE